MLIWMIASYDFGKPFNFKNKKPLTVNIKILGQLCNLKNIELHRFNNEVNEKNEWLNKYPPFFEKDDRTIISKESYPNYSSKELNYLKSLKLKNKLFLLMMTMKFCELLIKI